MENIKEKHVRFYIDMTEAEDNQLKRLADMLGAHYDFKITKSAAIKLAVKKLAKKEGV